MKLSEAIRIGAKMHPQGFDRYISVDDHGQLVTCALGAAAQARGILDVGDLCSAFPILNQLASPHSGLTVFRHIQRLNDFKHWTRERIADCVEEREKKLSELAARAS